MKERLIYLIVIGSLCSFVLSGHKDSVRSIGGTTYEVFFELGFKKKTVKCYGRNSELIYEGKLTTHPSIDLAGTLRVDRTLHGDSLWVKIGVSRKKLIVVPSDKKYVFIDRYVPIVRVTFSNDYPIYD